MDDLGLAEAIRSFNRFYTEAIGSLADQHEGLAVSLAQARVLHTVASMHDPQVKTIADALRLDLAYTSRVLGSLEDKKLIRRTISLTDRRERVVRLTPNGRRLLSRIEVRSNKRVLGMVRHLDDEQLAELLDSMNTIRSLLTTQEIHGQSD